MNGKLNDIAKETNEFLLRRLVACVGGDYKQDYSPHLWPDFSEETIALWNEAESRMKEPTCLNFDRDSCLSELREEIRKQSDILKDGPDYSTSYHYGIRSGLNLALGIIEKHIKKE